MFDASEQVCPQYPSDLGADGNSLTAEAHEQKRQTVALSFLRQGTTFTVYGGEEKTEKIPPF